MKKTFIEELTELKLLLLEYSTEAKKQDLSVSDEYVIALKKIHSCIYEKIDDDELYKLWKTYGKYCAEWNKIYAPQLNEVSKGGKGAKDLLKQSLDCLNKIIQAANIFIEAYQSHKEKIVGEVMQNNFKKWVKETQEALDDKKDGWLFLQNYVDNQYKIFLAQKAIITTLKEKAAIHKTNIIVWKNRVIPNINALLVEQQDVDTVQTIYDNLQELLKNLSTAPKNIQDKYIDWKTLAEKSTWQERLKHIKKMFINTKNRHSSKLIDGNPELAEKNKSYTYEEPIKKEQLYQKGKKDQYDIDANDVQQGDLEDCFLLSSIAALAKNAPNDIKKLIKEKSDGSFEVTLYLRKDPSTDKRTATIISVKNEFVRNKKKKTAYAGKGDNELWVQVLEKAYAQAMGGYDALLDGGSSLETLQVLTGKTATKGLITKGEQTQLLAVFNEALKNKTPLTLGSMNVPSNGNPHIILNDGQKIYYSHFYYLDKIDGGTFYLKNPHGKDHLELNWQNLCSYFIDYAKL